MVKQPKMIQSNVIVFMQKFSIPERIWKRLDCIYETLMNEDNVVRVFQIEEKREWSFIGKIPTEIKYMTENTVHLISAAPK